MSKVCLSLVLLAIAYVVSRAADVGDTSSDSLDTVIPLKNDPWKDSSEEEDEDEDKADHKTNEEYSNPLDTAMTHLSTIRDTLKQLEEFHGQGKKTPPDTRTLTQAIMVDAANRGTFYVRFLQKENTGSAILEGCFFEIGENVTRLMFTSYENLENCEKAAKAAYQAALSKINNKIVKTKEKLTALTHVLEKCQHRNLRKLNNCLSYYLPRFLRASIQMSSGASKAQLTYVKRIAHLNENYKICAGQANSTLYEQLEPLRTAAENCKH